MMRPLVITGKNPQRPNVVPTGGTVPKAVQLFGVTLPAGSAGFTVTPGAGAPAPIGYSANSFSVDFSAAAGTFSYTVTDTTTGLSSSVTITA